MRCNPWSSRSSKASGKTDFEVETTRSSRQPPQAMVQSVQSGMHLRAEATSAKAHNQRNSLSTQNCKPGNPDGCFARFAEAKHEKTCAAEVRRRDFLSIMSNQV
ncbi:unnamed protein product [Effrenium voratum]|uniref:Uncharacterized protein n=1 Tax=Effrenium voratum TaxID=2562239 RepID=A0AA36JDX1_9DINO|nr:unnamed protein product [Effrenium voratum]